MSLHAKKSLGQNFLTSTSAITKMVSSADVIQGDTVLEIGPGKGVLTAALLEAGARVIAVEKDDRLIPYLQELFKSEIETGNLTLIHGDILELVEKTDPKESYKLIANIPYYITGKIISSFLEATHKPKLLVVMVQYEVAKRITSQKEKSILSLSVEVFGRAKLIDRVSAGSFFPKPKVDSAILAIYNISDKKLREYAITERQFFSIIKSGFAHKRKKLINNLKDGFPLISWDEVFIKHDLPTNTRAETVDLDTWCKLAQETD